MKIGILTFHRPCNFGANLQAYSNCRYFASLGHEVKVIDYTRPSDASYKNSISEEQQKAHTIFVARELPLTKNVTTAEGIADVVLSEGFDLIVVGADAVWRSPKDKGVFFGSWLFNYERLKDIPIVALSAAHMGHGFGDLSEEQSEQIKGYLKRFKYASVRDVWTQSMVNNTLFGGESYIKNISPDPVFMLNGFVDKEWINNGVPSKGYYLMTLKNNWADGKMGKLKKIWFRRFKKIINEAGYLLVELPLPEGVSGMKFDVTVPYPIDPLQWYLWIKNAKAFCGLRFHAIVSSISAGTPFYSVDNYGSCTPKKAVLNLLGAYAKARQDDETSKIMNLLRGSGFEKNRVDGFVETINPHYLFKLLEHTDINKIISFRDSEIKVYQKSVQEAFVRL